MTFALAVTAFMLTAAGQAALPPPSPGPRGYASSPVDTAHGDRESVLLWPEGAPGALGTEPSDRPKLTLYRAPAAGANGAAVVVCPGGSYHTLASDHEGKQVAEWLNSLGVSAFVLQYRVGPRYRHPAPLQDAQRALRLVRARARDLAIDPARVGILGFSAGGHLAATTGTHFDDGKPDAADPIERMGSRPDFMVLAYPVMSFVAPFAHGGSRQFLLGDAPDAALAAELSNETQVTARTPPAFLFHTAADASVPVENSLVFFEALKKAGVPAELHVFPHGRHGVGLAPQDPVLSQWPKLCAAWLRGMGFLGAPPAAPSAFASSARSASAFASSASAASPGADRLHVGGLVSRPLDLGADEFGALPHREVRAIDVHGKGGRFRGVLLEEILRRAGAVSGEDLRGAHLRDVVRVECADGYVVAFMLAELDPAMGGRAVLVADSRDGAALGPEEGPWRLVVPDEKRPARWARQVKSITVARLD